MASATAGARVDSYVLTRDIWVEWLVAFSPHLCELYDLDNLEKGGGEEATVGRDLRDTGQVSNKARQTSGLLRWGGRSTPRV